MTGSDRRPLSSRDTGWARAITAWLATTPVTPNQISMASMVAAALAGAGFWAAGSAEGWLRSGLFVAAALFCQLRLLCNLFDGLVAVEGGRQAADGPFWNEFPDRVADILILVGAGLGAAEPALGWAAAGFAVLTAYVRELGRANGLPSDFSGPMAKQHRMALMTAAALAAACAPLWPEAGLAVPLALWAVAIGAGLTALRRAAAQVRGLKGRAGDA
ncbi:CDP-alcohol phosphatidyltransferase family protein [Aquibium microcysteis]|uniref:CDP-alcohol phosphatidyltransferase family protein n=1 Tax=Aquibium microcysteis TaxID=675281 RepID=UPI00165D1019|nr:CDP-alcohol phosphatidyltransferase family protein [Aquibium microcysteis]